MPLRKLAISMVPPALWGLNLKKLLPQGEWNRIRRAAFAEDPSCAGCGAVPSGADRHGHEEWRYARRGRTATARLLGVRTTCRKCHLVQHPGFVAVMTAKGVFPASTSAALERHYCAVNECTPAGYRRELAAAEEALVELMDVRRWRLDFGPYRKLVLPRLPKRWAGLRPSRVPSLPEPPRRIGGRPPRAGR